MSNYGLKRIYLIRHGETDPNKNHIIQGSGLDAPLNARGRQQAQDFFSAYKHIPFEVVFTSNLVRTHQSVEPFLKTGIPHIALKELNEISWGVKDGTKIDSTEQKIYNSLLNDWSSGLLDRAFENGESPNMVAKRLRVAIQRIQDSEFSNLLVCIHGRAMRIFLCLVLGTPLSHMEEFLHSNLCLYILTFDGVRWGVELKNDTSHLLG
jgi:broad specificity phosphatase PhoE